MKFTIQQTDPVLIKEEIFNYWEKYLPGTPKKRFNWLQSNPEGKTEWFFAYNGQNNELAGVVSVMRHDLYYNGMIIHAGVVGDFMVGDKYRVYGPAMQLQKSVVECKNKMGLDILYTIPNSASLKLCRRTGYLGEVTLCHMMRPLKSQNYILRNWNGTFIKSLICAFVDRMLKILPIQISYNKKYHFQTDSSIDGSFDDFWTKISQNQDFMVGNRATGYLKWRYINNPESEFKFMKYLESGSTVLLGYIAYCQKGNRISIYDIMALKNEYIAHMINQLLRLAYSEGCHAIYIRISRMDSYLKILKRYMFLDANDDIPLMVFDDIHDIDYSKWAVYECDRNI